MINLQSSNPALANDDLFQQYYGGAAAARPQEATLQGVVNKTALLVALTVVAGMGTYAALLQVQVPGLTGTVTWMSALAGFIVTLGVYFVIRSNPKAAVWAAPVYAIVEGVFLGALTCALDGMLAGIMTAQAPDGVAAAPAVSLALPAFIITISVMLAMLGLYKAGILRPTKMFVSVVSTLTLAVMLMYAFMFLMSFIAPSITIPFLSINSAFQGGSVAWIGVGVNLLILGLASMWLIIDFKLVEDIVESGQPKVMEWYAGFALLVTLAWIYYEAVKLCFRLYLLFGSRD